MHVKIFLFVVSIFFTLKLFFQTDISPSKLFGAKVLTDELNSEIDSIGRVCRSCRRRKVWAEFHKKENGINGRHSKCAECIKKAKVKARRKNKIPKIRSLNMVDFSTCTLSESFVSDSLAEARIDKLLRGLVYDTIFELNGDDDECGFAH